MSQSNTFKREDRDKLKAKELKEETFFEGFQYENFWPFSKTTTTV